MEGLPQLQRLASEALVVILQLATALAQVREGNVPASAQALSAVVRAEGPSPVVRRYADEALYWRARLAESQAEKETEVEARSAAVQDYIELMNRLARSDPEGRLRREARVRLAALSEPGRHLPAADALAASGRNLRRMGKALHDYAADHGGRLPGALEDLFGDYVTDETLLVRPGARDAGGGRAYVYRPGVRAELNVTTSESGGKVLLSGGVPVLVWEPTAGKDRRRLVLRLDGEVRMLEEPPERAGPGGAEGAPAPRRPRPERPAGPRKE